MTTQILENPTAQQHPITKTPRRLRAALTKKLLSLAGLKVLWQEPEPDAERLLERGQLFSQSLRPCPGERSMCHQNAADLWARNFKQYQLVTGYCLDRETWMQHSWVLDGATICETTCRFDGYFGVILRPFEAYNFFLGNHLLRHYSDPQQRYAMFHEQYLRLALVSFRYALALIANGFGSESFGSDGLQQDAFLEKLFNEAMR